MRKNVVFASIIAVAVSLIVGGLGITFAFYEREVSGAVSGKTANYAGEIELISGGHNNIIPATDGVDQIDFYVKNYTGSDSAPTAASEVKLSYVLTFTLPTWPTGCTNPVSLKLYKVNESVQPEAETEVTLSSNSTSAINFTLASAEKDKYRLKLYWNTTYNSVTCYAGKTGNIGINANIYQTDV